MDKPKIEVDLYDGVAEVVFFHPKANAFTVEQLTGAAESFHHLGGDDRVRVIVLRSLGEKVFSAGAYFDELSQLENLQAGKNFFWAFARLILSMIRCPKPIVGCIGGKAIGGAVGLVAACDYAIASHNASMRLSELSIGIGPFVIEPVVSRRIGLGHFMSLSLDPTRWRSARWCKDVGLVADVVEQGGDLENTVLDFARQLSAYNPEAARQMKKVFWEGAERWDELLRKRAALTASLVLTPQAKAALRGFKER